MTLQHPSFKWNNSHISDTYIKFQPSTHVLVHCTYYVSMFVVCRIEVEPEPESTPSLKTPILNIISKASNPPLIMSIKSHFSLSLAYALFRMITMIRFYRIVEPIPLHDLSFCHSSKQTTILANVGVD